MAKILDEQIQFEGTIYASVGRTIELDSGDIIKRDLVIKNECIVALVAHKTKDVFILTEEFRVGSMDVSLGSVAGIVDDGETPMEACVREVKEEIGYTPTLSQYLGYTYSSSGFTNEKIHYFYVEVDGEPEAQSLDQDEQINVVEIETMKLYDLIEENKITNSHLMVAVLKASLALASKNGKH